GPNSAPAIAAPNAEPISCPRRPPGAAATSHASAPVHVNALETPWKKRATSSDHSESASPKATVVAVRMVRPVRTAGLTPKRAVAHERLRRAGGFGARRQQLADDALDRAVELVRHFVDEADSPGRQGVEPFAGEEVAPRVRADPREHERRDDGGDDPELDLRE